MIKAVDIKDELARVPFLKARGGMMIVVPRAHWHRFNAPERVTVLTATPQPTEHTFAEDPVGKS